MIEFKFPLVIVIASFVISTNLLAVEESPAKTSPGFRLEAVNERSLGIWEGEQLVFIYNHGLIAQPIPDERPHTCYLHPICGLDGEVLTDDFPKDHVYHRGVFWAWPHITINDQEYELWTARGALRQQFQRWLTKDASHNKAKLSVENAWSVFEANAIMNVVREQVTIEVYSATNSSRAIDLELTWTPLEHALTLRGAKDKSYGGFNFRFAPRTKTVITVPENVQLPGDVNASAGRVSGDLLVTRLPWADFSGDFRGTKGTSGAAIFVHPQHPDFPPTWMARHYGLVSVGWPGVEPRTFPVNESITCRYRIWIHRGSPSSAEIQAAYEAYRSSQRAESAP